MSTRRLLAGLLLLAVAACGADPYEQVAHAAAGVCRYGFRTPGPDGAGCAYQGTLYDYGRTCPRAGHSVRWYRAGNDIFIVFDSIRPGGRHPVVQAEASNDNRAAAVRSWFTEDGENGGPASGEVTTDYLTFSVNLRTRIGWADGCQVAEFVGQYEQPPN